MAEMKNQTHIKTRDITLRETMGGIDQNNHFRRTLRIKIPVRTVHLLGE